MVSLPASPLTTSESLAGFGAGDRHLRRQPVDHDQMQPLLAMLIVSSPAVPLTITCPPLPSPPSAPGARQVDGDLRHAGAGQVVDRDGVGAAQRVRSGCARRR